MTSTQTAFLYSVKHDAQAIEKKLSDTGFGYARDQMAACLYEASRSDIQAIST